MHKTLFLKIHVFFAEHILFKLVYTQCRTPSTLQLSNPHQWGPPNPKSTSSHFLIFTIIRIWQMHFIGDLYLVFSKIVLEAKASFWISVMAGSLFLSNYAYTCLKNHLCNTHCIFHAMFASSTVHSSHCQKPVISFINCLLCSLLSNKLFANFILFYIFFTVNCTQSCPTSVGLVIIRNFAWFHEQEKI